MESIVVTGDLILLSAEDRVKFYVQVCEAMHLDVRTRPLQYFEQIDILQFIIPTDIISFPDLTGMENFINGIGMIFDIQPVTDVFTFTVNRDELVIPDIIY